jgi:aminotransferase
MRRISRKAESFTESVIREMNRLAVEAGAVSLAQGFPDFACPIELKEAAAEALFADVNQYAITWGARPQRQAIAAKTARFHPGWESDPETQITVTCGATEGMIASMLGLLDPGDEVIVFEPFYENYGPDAILCGAAPVFVPLAPDAPLDVARLTAAVSPRTRGIVLNTPNNPTGRVFSRAELEAVAELCRQHELIAFTDEIYEHILYAGEHVPLATLPGMRERTVTISGASKTFSVTGWRIGTIVAPADLTAAIRKVHDFLTVGAPAPLQEACATALETLDRSYYETLAREYRERRDVLYAGLVAAGFRCTAPQGAYYILADFSALSDLDDISFATWLARGGHHGTRGVAAVPGSSFFHRPEDGRRLVRFAFCKHLTTLREAGDLLRELVG